MSHITHFLSPSADPLSSLQYLSTYMNLPHKLSLRNLLFEKIIIFIQLFQLVSLILNKSCILSSPHSYNCRLHAKKCFSNLSYKDKNTVIAVGAMQMVYAKSKTKMLLCLQQENGWRVVWVLCICSKKKSTMLATYFNKDKPPGKQLKYTRNYKQAVLLLSWEGIKIFFPFWLAFHLE